MLLNDIMLTKNFNLNEFDSPDTHQVKLHQELIVRLQTLRDKVKKPIKVTSGYRTNSYNRRVGGARGSFHKRGMAADIHCPGISTKDLASIAEGIGFRGIGIYISQGFVHVDVGPKRSWTG